MEEVQETGKGIAIGGQNYNNLRYADNAVIMSEDESELQQMITKLSEVCKEYEMDINTKKTKTVMGNKSGRIPCNISINNTRLEQVSQYKYLGSWITEDCRCEIDVKSRIGMAEGILFGNIKNC